MDKKNKDIHFKEEDFINQGDDSFQDTEHGNSGNRNHPHNNTIPLAESAYNHGEHHNYTRERYWSYQANQPSLQNTHEDSNVHYYHDSDSRNAMFNGVAESNRSSHESPISVYNAGLHQAYADEYGQSYENYNYGNLNTTQRRREEAYSNLNDYYNNKNQTSPSFDWRENSSSFQRQDENHHQYNYHVPNYYGQYDSYSNLNGNNYNYQMPKESDSSYCHVSHLALTNDLLRSTLNLRHDSEEEENRPYLESDHQSSNYHDYHQAITNPIHDEETQRDYIRSDSHFPAEDKKYSTSINPVDERNLSNIKRQDVSDSEVEQQSHNIHQTIDDSGIHVKQEKEIIDVDEMNDYEANKEKIEPQTSEENLNKGNKRKRSHSQPFQRKIKKVSHNDTAIIETDLSDDIGAIKVIWKGDMITYEELLSNEILNVIDIPRRKVMIYWDIENVPPSSNHLTQDEITKSILRFGQKHGKVLAFKAFANENVATNQSNYIQLMSNNDVDFIVTPGIYSGSERADNEIIVDMMLNTGKVGKMKHGDIFIIISMDADFVVPISVLRQHNYNVIVLVPPRDELKKRLFAAPNSFYTIGDEGFYKINSYKRFQELVKLTSDRKLMEPLWKKKLREGSLANESERIKEEAKLMLDLT